MRAHNAYALRCPAQRVLWSADSQLHRCASSMGVERPAVRAEVCISVDAAHPQRACAEPAGGVRAMLGGEPQRERLGKRACDPAIVRNP